MEGNTSTLKVIKRNTDDKFQIIRIKVGNLFNKLKNRKKSDTPKKSLKQKAGELLSKIKSFDLKSAPKKVVSRIKTGCTNLKSNSKKVVARIKNTAPEMREKRQLLDDNVRNVYDFLSFVRDWIKNNEILSKMEKIEVLIDEENKIKLLIKGNCYSLIYNKNTPINISAYLKMKKINGEDFVQMLKEEISEVIPQYVLNCSKGIGTMTERTAQAGEISNEFEENAEQFINARAEVYTLSKRAA